MTSHGILWFLFSVAVGAGCIYVFHKAGKYRCPECNRIDVKITEAGTAICRECGKQWDPSK